MVHSHLPSSLPVTPALSQLTSNTIASGSFAHAAKNAFPALSLIRLAISIRISGVTRAELISAIASISFPTVCESESPEGESNRSTVCLNTAGSSSGAGAEAGWEVLAEFDDLEWEAGVDCDEVAVRFVCMGEWACCCMGYIENGYCMVSCWGLSVRCCCCCC